MLAGARLASTHRRFAGNGYVSDPDLCAGHSGNADRIATRWNFTGGTRARYFRIRLRLAGVVTINGPHSDTPPPPRHALLPPHAHGASRQNLEHRRYGHDAPADRRDSKTAG